MSSIIEGYNYDVFISYRQKDNKYDGWVSEFVDNLTKELEATFKEEISVYFDINPHDGLHEHHDVDDSLKEKLKCLVFIPIISRTYCDPKSFAWENEFRVYVEQASKDQFGLKVKLPGGNTASRVLPVRIHELEEKDIKLFEAEINSVLRSIDFIFKSAGVNRPLLASDKKEENSYRTHYRDQINKVANAISEIIYGLMRDKNPADEKESIPKLKKEESLKHVIERLRNVPGIPGKATDKAKTVSWPLVVALVIITSLLTGIIQKYFSSRNIASDYNNNTAVAKTIIEFPQDAPLALVGSTPGNIGRPALTLSPDATQLVLVAQVDSITTKLYLHRMDGFDFIPLEGTENAYHPFFSPDGHWIGFFSKGKLKKVSVRGGKPVIVCDASNPYGGVWSKNGKIIFTPNEGTRLMGVSSNGGNPEDLFEKNKRPDVGNYNGLFLMPDQEHIIYADYGSLRVLSLRTGVVKDLAINGAMPLYYKGFLIFAESGRLLSVRFNENTLEPFGSPFPVIESVRTEVMMKFAHIGFAENGTIVYVPGMAADYTSFFWADRKGNIQIPDLQSDYYGMFTLSPDGQKIAFCKTSFPSKIGIIDIRQNTSIEIPSDKNDLDPVWSPDGKSIVYFSYDKNKSQLKLVNISSLDHSQNLLEADGISTSPYSFLRTGNAVSFYNFSKRKDEPWIQNLFLGDTGRLETVLGNVPYACYGASFSPDGKYFAYNSDESGRYEVYVRPYPTTGERWQISTEGGFDVLWSPEGNEIFFRGEDNIFVSEVDTKSSFTYKKPQVVYTGQFQDVASRSFDVTADGQKMLMLRPVSREKIARRAIVITNWQEELKRLSPAK